MELIPAIDVRGGRVVRLIEGDFARETMFDTDPLASVRRWVGIGAPRLHIVDLDGARAGRPVQVELVGRMVASAGASGVPCQVAGGLRDGAAADSALAAGADRVVLGTALLRDSSLAGRLVAAHGPARVVAALDVRDGLAVGEGWRVGADGLPMADTLAHVLEAGVRLVAVTAIARDGRLEGPDVGLYRQLLMTAPGALIIASGGVTTVDDLLQLRDVGCHGAILGRALYDGRLDLAEALEALS